MKHLNLLLVCGLLSVCLYTDAQTWSKELSIKDGLPGNYDGTSYYEYTTPVYSFDEPVKSVRITVLSTRMTDSNKDNSTNGYFLAYGEGYEYGSGLPYTAFDELKALDSEGNVIKCSNAVSNAIDSYYTTTDDLQFLWDGELGASLYTTMYMNADNVWPSEYHYVELQFEAPVTSLSLTWTSGYAAPTNVGITVNSTQYETYPSQKFVLGEQVTSVEDIDGRSSLYVLKGNVPEYMSDYYGYPPNTSYPGSLYMSTPYGGTVTPSAASLVRLVPAGVGEYYIYWLNSDRYLSSKVTSKDFIYYATNIVEKAEKVSFHSNGNGDFEIAAGDEFVAQNSKGFLMRLPANKKVEYSGDVSQVYNAFNFSLFKAEASAAALYNSMRGAVESAKRRIEGAGDLSGYDSGELMTLQQSIVTIESLMGDEDADSKIALDALDAMDKSLLQYLFLKFYSYEDSVSNILRADDIQWCDEVLIYGGFPNSEKEKLEVLLEDLSRYIVSCSSIAMFDELCANIESRISAFWDSRINVQGFPIIATASSDRLPGIETNGQYVWNSTVYTLDKPVDGFRITFLKSNVPDMYNEYPVFALSELVVKDFNGNVVNIVADALKTNSQESTEGDLSNICDGDNSTYYHSTWKSGTVPYSEVYIDVKLPEELNAFSIGLVSRNLRCAPLELALTAYGERYSSVLHTDNKWNAVQGERVMRINDIAEDGYYVIRSKADDACWMSGTKAYHETIVHGECVFKIQKDDKGLLNLQSLGNAKYWSSMLSDGKVESNVFRQYASQLVAEDVVGDGTFVLYENTGNDDLPYRVYYDGKNYVRSVEVSDLSQRPADGCGEWLIYRVSLDNAEFLMMSNLIPAIREADVSEVASPGYFADLGSLPGLLEEAHECVDNKDYSKAPEILVSLEEAFAAVDDNNRLKLVEGADYDVESAHSLFYEVQGSTKHLYAYGGYLYWYPWYGEYAEHYFNFTAAGGMDEYVEQGLITDEQAKNAYYIGSKAYGNEYLYCASAGYYLEIGVTPSVWILERIPATAKYRILYADNVNYGLSTYGGEDGTEIYSWIYCQSVSNYPDITTWYLRGSVSTSINENVAVDSDVISVEYYTINGVKVDAPVQGITIKRTVTSDGTIKSTKIFKR